MPETTQQASMLDALMEAVVDTIITIDHAGIIQSINAAGETLFGYSSQEMVGNNVNMLMPKHHASHHDGFLQRYAKTGEKHIIGTGREVEGKRKDDTLFHMHLSVGEFEVDGEAFYVGVIHDLTARKTAEAALAMSQKLEAIGQLSGGIAHDFNNLLTVITGNLEFLEMQLDDDAHKEMLYEALGAAEMGADLTNRLLAFARRSILQPQPTDLTEKVESIFAMLARTLGTDIELSTLLAEDLWAVSIDPGQFESVLLNLAVNARDAMPRGGKLIIETSNITVDDKFMMEEAEVKAGDYVRVSVSDTGNGIPEADLPRVFEPFFTTKAVGEGTGLGLSMVYGFAKQSGGHANLYSEMGVGTTLNLYLPRAIESAEADGAAETEHVDLPVAKKGNGELVLVVEDNPQIQKLSVQRLEALNYTSIVAGNGREALKLIEENKDIALVFTDLVMPGMSGYELAEVVSRKFPGLPILMTSGYAEDLMHANDLSSRSMNLLRKPYKLKEMGDAISRLLAPAAKD